MSFPLLGRRWLVRLDPYGTPAAGVTVIKCAGDAACVPDGTRFRDPVLARTRALEHVRQHVARITELRDPSRCSCRHADCGWHQRQPVACAGPVTLVLIPDSTGRLWVIAETCAACAAAVPRAKVLRSAPVPPTAAERRAAERERALRCAVCATEAPRPAAPEPVAPPEPEPVSPHTGDTFHTAESLRRDLAVPAAFTDHLAGVLRFLDLAEAGRSTEARYLALLLALRVRTGGIFRLVDSDLRSDRMNVPEWALQELIDSGWARVSLEAVRAAVPGSPCAEGVLPDLVSDTAHLGVPGAARSRLNGWVQRTTCHPLLHDHGAVLRMAAVLITSLADENGYARITPRSMATMCRLASPDLSQAVLADLVAAGWLTRTKPGNRPSEPVAATLAMTVRHLAPGYTPPKAPATPTITAPRDPLPRPSSTSLRGREFQVAAWVDTYVTRHGHGPKPHDLLAAHCTENPRSPWPDYQMSGALERLADEGWLLLDSTRWYRTRPGPAYQRQLSDQRHTAPPAPQANATPRAPQARSEPSTPGPLSGLWLLPGAEAILGPPPVT